MTTQTLVHGGEAGRWEQAIYAFLAEKERRSGSRRTARVYSGMLYPVTLEYAQLLANKLRVG